MDEEGPKPVITTKERTGRNIEPVIQKDEVQRYQDLGLGRGVNVTDPQMWKNKSHFLIRKVCSELLNIIGTEECGMKEKYEKEVSTVAKQQDKIRLSLDEPNSRVKIGMDAQHSQSTSSTKKIAGTKIKTRTISFRVDCKDLPVCTSSSNPSTETLTSLHCDTDEYFENSLYSWIMKRICDRRERNGPKCTPCKEKCACDVDDLVEHLRELKPRSQEIKEIAKDCKMFVKDLGITHYVSSIELGALEYSASTISSRQTKYEVEADIHVGKLAEGGGSRLAEKLHFQMSREQHQIGKFSVDGTVERNTTNEAVIGFQIKPIHNLVRLQLIQVALQKAVKQYIEFKADRSVGPFLISCKINKKFIYWRANEDQQQIVGTDSKDEASFFFVAPAQDIHHPSEFFITHYDKQECDETDPFMKLQITSKQSQRPQYVASNCNLFGFSSRPLELKSTLLTRQRFSLHSRVQQSFAYVLCTSTPVNLTDWIEGEEVYINCSQHSFKVDGYVAMKQLVMKNVATYQTQTVATMKDTANSKGIGMLFRLEKCNRSKDSQIPKPSLCRFQLRSDESCSEDETSSSEEKSSEDEITLTDRQNHKEQLHVGFKDDLSSWEDFEQETQPQTALEEAQPQTALEETQSQKARGETQPQTAPGESQPQTAPGDRQSEIEVSSKKHVQASSKSPTRSYGASANRPQHSSAQSRQTVRRKSSARKKSSSVPEWPRQLMLMATTYDERYEQFFGEDY